MSKILEKAVQYFQENLPFVLYCKPNSEELIAFFQKNDVLHEVADFDTSGFVFNDFLGEKSFLFPELECEIFREKYNCEVDISTEPVLNDAIIDKDKFEQLVLNGIQAIKNGRFQKVVLSRKETLQKENFDFSVVFRKMLALYPTAFRYCWFHPKVGFWMGATPEQLLKVDGQKFKTVALAGTQKWQEDSPVIWQEKERKEQQFVTDYITSKLKSEVETLTKSEPYSFKAGKVVHLKTDIEGVFHADFSLKKIVSVLHPTPAVCGLPTKEAKDFIMTNEGYDRRFYAGFLGELKMQSTSDLYVNLRCMEIEDNEVHLYVGCGITKESQPEKEYFETVNKAMTMKQILN